MKTRTRWPSPPLGEGSRDGRGLGAGDGSVDEPRRDRGGRRAGSIARAAARSSPFGEARGEGAGERAQRGEPGRAGVGEPDRAARGGEPTPRREGTLEDMLNLSPRPQLESPARRAVLAHDYIARWHAAGCL